MCPSDYLPNGMPYRTTDTAGASRFPLHDPTPPTVPITEVAPPHARAGPPFLTAPGGGGLATSGGAPARGGRNAT